MIALLGFSLLVLFRWVDMSMFYIFRPERASTLDLMQLKMHGKQAKKMQQHGEGTNLEVDYLHRVVKSE